MSELTDKARKAAVLPGVHQGHHIGPALVVDLADRIDELEAEVVECYNSAPRRRLRKLETALQTIAAFADVQPGPYADVVRLAYITGLHELAHKAKEALDD